MPPSSNPFVGPRPFEAADAEFFFGRDREIADLVALIVSNPVVLLYAASGAGKSSLLNAAVIAKLENEQEFDVLPVARVRGLGDRVAEPAGNVYSAAVLSHIADGDPNAAFIHEQLAASERGQTSDGFTAARALVVDQLEEVFTAYPEKWNERPAFFEDLAAASRDDPLLRIVLSIREDFVAQIDPYARLFPDALQARYRLERLSAGAALRAAREPASRAGRPFAEDVAEALVEDLQRVRVDTERGPEDVVGEYVEPVQLQVACRSVWDALPESATEITEEHRQQFGNVNEVLGSFYDSAIAAAATAAHRRERTMRSRFAERFITASGTRGTVFWTREETGGIPAPAIKELEDRHVIRAEIRAGGRWFELTHDRLIEPVRASNREFVQRRSRRRNRLLALGAGTVIATAGAVAAVAGHSPNGSDAAPTGPSIAEQRAQRQLANTRTQLAVAYARTNRKALAASYQLHIGEIRTVTFTSEAELVAVGTGGARALPDGRAVYMGRGPVRAYVAGMGASLAALADGQLVLRRGSADPQVVAHLAGIRSIALRPDAELSAAVDEHGAHVFRGAGVVRSFVAPTGAGYSTIAFLADGRHIALTDPFGFFYTASISSKTPERLFGLPTGIDRGMTLSQDGRLIAAYGPSAAALLDPKGNVIGGYPGQEAIAVAFSPSGRQLAVAYRDGKVRLWRTLPDLRVVLTKSNAGPIVLDIANVGGSDSGPTSVHVRAEKDDYYLLPPLSAGKHKRIAIGRPLVPIEVTVARRQSFVEQSYTNNVVRFDAARAAIVDAALAGAAHPGAVRFDDSTLAATNDGALRHVHLPKLPRTATTTGFATWCYYAAGVPDPNRQRYRYPSQNFLRKFGTKVVLPKPGDLVMFESADLGRAVAVYVGDGEAVTFVKKRLARVPLRTLGASREFRTYPLR